MRTRTKWIVAGGAAAFVLTPVAAVYSSTAWDADLPQTGVVLDAEAANQARATQASMRPHASPTTKASTEATTEPSGKKTVSAPSPVSPKTPATKKPTTKKTTKTWTDGSADSPDSPDSPG